MQNQGTGIFKYLRGDKGIWCIMMILSFLSILAVYSATGRMAYRYQDGHTAYYMLKHAGILAAAWITMFIVHRIKYTHFAKLSKLMIGPVILLLLYTLTVAAVNDASRWISIFGVTFQTSELAKVVLVVYLARVLTKYQPEIKDIHSFWKIVWAPLVVCGLIFSENFSTAALLMLTCVVLMMVGGVSGRYLGGLVGTGVLAMGLVFAVCLAVPEESLPGRLATWKSRIEGFASDSEEAYQVTQAKIAVAGGKIIGKGPGNSTQRNFLPHPYSDYIYALIIEEYGMAFAVVVLLLYLWFLRRGISIARRCQGSFGSYMVLGLTFMLTLQALVNMGVAVDLLPVTGQPLPFLSMGGTSLLFTALSVGIILSVSASVQAQERQADSAVATASLRRASLGQEAGAGGGLKD